MATEVILPRVDMGMETGTISAWHVEAGQTVTKGQPLFEIETDKAAMEIEAPASGILAAPVAKGTSVPVGEIVGWILAVGEAVPGQAAPAADAAAVPPAVAASEPAAPAEPVATAAPASAADVRATPLARRTAKAAGVDLAAVAGSGPHGRIVVKDVEAVIAKPAAAAPAAIAAPVPAAAPAPAAPTVAEAPAPAAVPAAVDDGVERIPHDSMRRTIARRLTESKQTVPHFYLTVDCRLDALLALRAEINANAPVVGGEPAFRISVNDLVIKAMAMALQMVPDANVTWTDDAMLKYRHSDVGVAVSIPGGLITPVIRKAEEKSISAISREMKDLAARAKARKLKPEEYQGGTTSISNLGMYGIREFAAILNPPQSTILAVGTGERRIIEVDGAAVGATMMTVTLSTDHRAVDGALGATLLNAVRGLIEKPMTLLL